jgi:hypothetical protein
LALTYSGTALPVVNGGTGVTASTGTGSVVLNTGASLGSATVSDYETFTSVAAPTYAEGRIWYDSTQKALSYNSDISGNTLHVGQETQLKVRNSTGLTIAKGAPVYITSTSTGVSFPNIALAKADTLTTGNCIGLTNEAIANGADGYVVINGILNGVNTGTFTVGDILYVSPYSAGQLMNTFPPTGYPVRIGVVSYVNSSTGSIYINQSNAFVQASSVVGQVTIANGGTGQATQAAAITALTGTQTAGRYLRSDGANAVLAAIVAADVPTLNQNTTGTSANVTGIVAVANGGTGLTTTPVNGALDIGNGTGFTRATLTAGSGVSITNSAGGISISATGSGGTVTSVTGTAPIVSSGGTTPAISMAAATSSVNGYLTSTDWTTFNNKGSGTVTSVAATVPAFLSVSGSPITTSGTLAISLSGTALPIANGGTNSTATATAGGIGYGTGTAHAYTSAGTSGQVLTSAGTGTPTWSTPGGGAWTKIATINGSSMTPYGVFSGLSGYNAYYMVVNGLKTASGIADTLYVQFGHSGGTYITSSVAFSDVNANQGIQATSYGNSFSFIPIGVGRSISSSGNMTAEILFTGMVGGNPSFTAIYGFVDGYSASGVVGQVGGYLSNSNSITNLRILFAQGNAASGTITLYGLTI